MNKIQILDKQGQFRYIQFIIPGNLMSENEAKIFTVEEANELIPLLSELIAELQDKRDEVAEAEVEVDARELIGVSHSPGSDQEFEQLMAKHRVLVDEFYGLVDAIHSYGCFLKDVDLGLIDFHGVLEGQVVFFCWHLGEERINFWHEVETGYSDRKPLPD